MTKEEAIALYRSGEEPTIARLLGLSALLDEQGKAVKQLKEQSQERDQRLEQLEERIKERTNAAVEKMLPGELRKLFHLPEPK